MTQRYRCSVILCLNDVRGYLVGSWSLFIKDYGMFEDIMARCLGEVAVVLTRWLQCC